MTNLALLPGVLNVTVFAGDPASITFTWPTGALAGRTFSARIVDDRLASIDCETLVDGDDLIVTVAADDTATLNGAAALIEILDTTGDPRVVIAGVVRSTSAPAAPTTGTVTVEDAVAHVTVTVTPSSYADIGAASASALTAEIATRAAADTTLQTHIDTEAAARVSGDNAEATARAAADTTLQTHIDTEAATRATGDTTLQTNIGAEATARAAADALLIPLAQKGAASGVATLDGAGTIPDAQIPATITRDTELAAGLAALVASAPSTLDTLNELATALGDDPHLATTLTTLIGTKAAAADLVAEVARAEAAEAAETTRAEAAEAAIVASTVQGAGNVFVGPDAPTGLTAGAEYLRFVTDGDGTLLDIRVGVA